LCAVHHTHPTRADLLDDAVVAESATDHLLHCRCFPPTW
jgi:hypothetical protein